jgi:hypothetical protein
MAGKLGEVLKSMGGTLERRPAHPRRDQPVRAPRVAGMAASYGSSIVKLVSETVRGWDARTVTARLEARSAATSNISASTARWSAGWSAWGRCTPGRSRRE